METEKIVYSKKFLEESGGGAYELKHRRDASDSQKLHTKNQILILSYNRPRMLSEAIESVLGQSYQNFIIRVIDDGSDFDLDEIWWQYRDDRILIAKWPNRTPDERKIFPMISHHLNEEIAKIEDNDIIQYLCDDDIMGDNWLYASTAALESNPYIHIAVGKLSYFYDGDDYRSKSYYGLPGRSNLDLMWWGFGNFAHRRTCWQDENIKWRESHLGHSQDVDFAVQMRNQHEDVIDMDLVSLHKREHSKMLSNFLYRKDKEGKYLPLDNWNTLPKEIFGKMMED